MELLELIGVFQLGDKAAFVGRVKQFLLWQLWYLDSPLLECCHEHLCEASERAPFGLHFHVQLRADEEGNARQEHQHSRYGKAEGPAYVGLHINDNCCRDHDGAREGAVIPVEEAVDASTA